MALTAYRHATLRKKVECDPITSLFGSISMQSNNDKADVAIVGVIKIKYDMK